MCVHFLCGHLRVDCRFVFDFSSDATVQWGLQVVNYFIWQPAHTAAVVLFACSVLALEMFGFHTFKIGASSRFYYCHHYYRIVIFIIMVVITSFLAPKFCNLRHRV